jgi:SAM-dependent methyltransferase
MRSVGDVVLYAAVASLVLMIGRALRRRREAQETLAAIRKFAQDVSRRAAEAPAREVPAWPLTGEYPTTWPRYDRDPPEPGGPDVTRSQEWDGFWERDWGRSVDPATSSHDDPYFACERWLIPFLRGRVEPSILSVGCGVSLEVRAFAAAGFDATGLDLSPAALGHARTCDHWPSLGRKLIDEGDEHPGGSARWECGSVLDRAACPGPYDAITCRRLLHYFWHQGRLDEALLALKARLKPDGVLVVTTQNDIPAFTAIEVAALRAGFAWDWRTKISDGTPVPTVTPPVMLFVHGKCTG